MKSSANEATKYSPSATKNESPHPLNGSINISRCHHVNVVLGGKVERHRRSNARIGVNRRPLSPTFAGV